MATQTHGCHRRTEETGAPAAQNMVFGSQTEHSQHAPGVIFKVASRPVSWSRKLTVTKPHTTCLSLHSSSPMMLSNFCSPAHVWEVCVCVTHCRVTVLSRTELLSLVTRPVWQPPQQDVPSSAFHAVLSTICFSDGSQSDSHTHVTEPDRRDLKAK